MWVERVHGMRALLRVTQYVQKGATRSYMWGMREEHHTIINGEFFYRQEY